MDIYARILEERESKKLINRKTKQVGDILMKWMNKKSISTSDLTQSSGVARSQISNILTNRTKHPKTETMVALCIGLGLTYEQSMSFLADTGYYDFENDRRFDNDMVLYTMILKIPGIDIVHANILLILGMYELIKRENSVSWMPSLVPSYLTAAGRINKVCPDILSDISDQKDLLKNMYYRSDDMNEIAEKLEAIETEWEKSNEQ